MVPVSDGQYRVHQRLITVAEPGRTKRVQVTAPADSSVCVCEF